MPRHYLDHASSSPVRPVVLEAMIDSLRHHVADPGRVHSDGQVSRHALEDARERVAALFGARPREVVFTASGTEAVNTAIWGALSRSPAQPPSIVTTAVEHSSVLDSCRRSDAEVKVIGVDRLGRFDPDELIDELGVETALVSLQLANHEVGTVHTGVGAVIRAARQRGILVHVDACAAAGHVPIDFIELGADLCSVTAHTFGGPKGAAALLVHRGLRMEPFIVGGAQERARRGGIENVPAIVGFGAAATELISGDRLATEATTARGQTEQLLQAALEVDGVERLGDPIERLPHLVCLSVSGVEAEPILLGLDQRGIAVHSGSSCSSETLEPSPVLAAMGVDADHSLRPSVGWNTTDADVVAFMTSFPEVVTKLRELRT